MKLRHLILTTLFLALSFFVGEAQSNVLVTGYYASGLSYLTLATNSGYLPSAYAPASYVLTGYNATGVKPGATYTSGGTITGTASQTCTVTMSGGLANAVGTVKLTGANVIAASSVITLSNAGTGFGSGPTSATLSSGTATCSGTAVVATTLGAYAPLAVDGSGNLTAFTLTTTGSSGAATYTGGVLNIPQYSGGGGGSGTVSSGSGYAVPIYASAAGTTVGPSNITSDATGNNLNVPGAASIGSGGAGTQISSTAQPIANLPAASTVPPVTAGSNTKYTFIYVLDGTTANDCTVGGGSNLHWCYSNGTTWITAVSATAGTVTTVSVATANGVSGSVANATTTPAITLTLGAITPSSSIATGIQDGQMPTAVTTGASATLGGTYSTGLTINENATAATAITYTLPTAAPGKWYCVTNGYNGSAANTGTLELLTSAAGQYIIFTDGSLSATGGYVISAGAARDAACVVGQDSTHWILYPQSGTWTKH